MSGLFAKKPIDFLTGKNNLEKNQLSRTLSAFDLAMVGVGAVVGTGIFVLTGVAAATHAGPALVLSFIIAGLACVMAGLCYSELSSTIPAAGSVYAYSYVAFGEVIAWMLGWDLVLEYGVAASAVASGWSGYFQGLLSGFGLHIPKALSNAYDPQAGTLIDLPAVLIILFIVFLLSRGINKTAKFNKALVILKLAIVLLFIVVGVWYVKPSNWSPFMPFGLQGIFTGAATAFFAYIGFDIIANAAEEVKNPQRDLPRGIIGSLAVCTVLYITVSLILTGIVPYTQLNVKNPVAYVLQVIGQDWIAGFISLGAIVGITTVLLALIYGLTRLLFAISRDGLLPQFLMRVDEHTKAPVRSTWLVGVIIAFFAGVLPLNKLADLTNIGTLFAFAGVSLGVLVLRKTHPELKRGFRVPFSPVLPILSVLACVGLMSQLPAFTWIGFFVWLIIGIVVYTVYGYKNSVLRK